MPFLGPVGEFRAAWAALTAGELGWDPLVLAVLLLLLRASRLPAGPSEIQRLGFGVQVSTR